MSHEPWIAYVGPFRFPWGQAGSRRVFGICAALASQGRKVVVVSGEAGPSRPERLELPGGGWLWHVGVGELETGRTGRLARALQALVLQGARTRAWLEAQSTAPSHLVVYGGYAAFMARMERWARPRGVPLLADVVEWYDPAHVPGGRWGPFNLSTNVALRHYYPRCDGVIAISAWLRDHYGPHTRTTRIPPTLDVEAVPFTPATNDGGFVGLFYAGTPGRKDLLVNVLAAISRVDPRGERFRLTVAGCTSDDLRAMLAGPLPAGVSGLGRVPQWEVASLYGTSDFSVLLREPKRFAQAGFPTKVPESLAAGVPVLCNLTSDLGEYMRDGREALFCSDHGVDAFARVLVRAAELTPAVRLDMRRAARSCAERHFDYRVYGRQLAGFFEEVRS